MGQRNLQHQAKPNRNLEWRSESSQQPSDPLLTNIRSSHSDRPRRPDHPGSPEHLRNPDHLGSPEHLRNPDHLGRPDRPDMKATSQQIGPLADQAMQWAKDFWEFNRSRLIIIAVLVGAILVAAVWFASRSGPTTSQIQPEDVIPLALPVTTQSPPQKIVVHVTGAVSEPGVYSLSSKARVYELILEAGGTTPTADTTSVNLAQPLVDGTQICIPEAQDLTSCAANCCQGQNQTPDSPGQQLINPNSATGAELESLPGIGPVLASEIEAYRQQGGRFSSAEDLLAIPGIGAATLKRFEALLFFP